MLLYVGFEPKAASSVLLLVFSLVHCDEVSSLLGFPPRRKAAPQM